MTIFILLATVILLIFIAGIIVFIIQYRNRKVLYQKEKDAIEEQHKMNLLNVKLQSQHDTMYFIGNEIHDSVAQKLTLASIYSQRVEFENSGNPIGKKLADISTIINESLLELRQLSRNLTDQQLQTASLGELVQMECDKVNSTGVCIASYQPDPLPATSIAVKSALFRIVQEFIQNSIKHAECREITISITNVAESLLMVLQDDGKGFDLPENIHRGMGLNSIHRRVQKLGGNYSWESKDHKGAKLVVTIPYTHIND